MATSHCIVLAIAVIIAIYSYTRNMAGLEKSCPADGYFKNNGSLKVDDLIYLDEGIAVCDEDRCYLTTYCTLEKYYGTLFSEGKSNDTLYTDGDRCCPTHFKTTIYKGEKKDVNNSTCKIIVLPKKGRNNTTRFQHVTAGVCSPGCICNYTNALCRQEYVPQPLLARKEGEPIYKIGFYQFGVPAYCSCKNF